MMKGRHIAFFIIIFSFLMIQFAHGLSKGKPRTNDPLIPNDMGVNNSIPKPDDWIEHSTRWVSTPLYPIQNQNFTLDSSGWIYGESADIVANGEWSPSNGNLDPGCYRFSVYDDSTNNFYSIDQYINYSFFASSVPNLAKVYGAVRLQCNNDCLVRAEIRLLRPDGSETEVWISSTYINTKVLDTGYIYISVDATSNFTLPGSYQLVLFTHSETDDNKKAAPMTTIQNYWDDAGAKLSYDLSGYIFSSNYSGQWTNSSWVAFPSGQTTAWSNVTESTASSTGYYSWRIYANNSANVWNDTGEQQIIVSKRWLEVNMVNPDPTLYTESFPKQVKQYDTFDLTAEVKCQTDPPGLDCNIVEGVARYNNTAAKPDEPISIISGDTPFYTTTNPISCDYMSQGNICQLNWVINTTGDIYSTWAIDAIFNSSLFTIVKNHTDDAYIKIKPLEYTIAMPSGYTCPQDCFIITAEDDATANETDQVIFRTPPTEFEVQPYRIDETNSQSGNIRPIALINNTGIVNIDLMIRLNEALPPGLAMYFNVTCTDCSSAISTKTLITTSYQTVITNLSPSGLGNISLWLYASGASLGTFTKNVYIRGQHS